MLDEVHRQIELHKEIRFILTGSSARKLKRSDVNLLGGRASRFYFHPITSIEMGFDQYSQNLERNITYGFLPQILLSSDPWQDLSDYVGIYLKEEIQQEAIVRSIDGFSRFLNTVALTNSEQINFTKIANDIDCSPKKVREYYQVLEDTLVGHLLEAFTKTKKRKAMTSAKFYLFDPGITNALLGRKFIAQKTKEFGNLFEQLVFCEIKAYLDYHQITDSLFYWRSTSKLEVDFIMLDPSSKLIAIKVKSSDNPSLKDSKGLLALEEDVKLKRKIIVCLSKKAKLFEHDVEVLPLQLFLEKLWGHKFMH